MVKKLPIIGIIDDDTIYHFILTSIINKNKLAESILSFLDGEKAIQYLTENKMNNEKIPDVLFLDVNMPIMDGYEMAQSLRHKEAEKGLERTRVIAQANALRRRK